MLNHIQKYDLDHILNLFWLTGTYGMFSGQGSGQGTVERENA